MKWRPCKDSSEDWSDTAAKRKKKNVEPPDTVGSKGKDYFLEPAKGGWL